MGRNARVQPGIKARQDKQQRDNRRQQQRQDANPLHKAASGREPQFPPVRLCTSSNVRQPRGQRNHVVRAASQAKAKSSGWMTAPNSEAARPAPPMITGRRAAFIVRPAQPLPADAAKAAALGYRPRWPSDPAAKPGQRTSTWRLAVRHNVIDMLCRRLSQPVDVIGRRCRKAALDNRAVSIAQFRVTRGAVDAEALLTALQ